MKRPAWKVIPVLRERDGDDCQLCREPLDFALPADDPGGATVDHRVPLAEGGTWRWANLQLAHRICNMRRAAGLQWWHEGPA